MEKTVEIRNLLIDKLKEAFGTVTVSGFNGNYFAAADFAIKGKNGDPEVYRLAVVKQVSQNSPR